MCPLGLYRGHFGNNSYDILELAYEANNISNNENKNPILEKIIAKIKVIDFLLNKMKKKLLTIT